MTVTEGNWEDRCRQVAAKRPPPPAPSGLTPIAATDLRVGDRITWGENHSLVITDVGRLDFVRATCSTAPMRRVGRSEPDTFTIDLHPLEEILVHTPRPDLQQESHQ